VRHPEHRVLCMCTYCTGHRDIHVLCSTGASIVSGYSGVVAYRSKGDEGTPLGGRGRLPRSTGARSLWNTEKNRSGAGVSHQVSPMPCRTVTVTVTGRQNRGRDRGVGRGDSIERRMQFLARDMLKMVTKRPQ